MGHANKHDGRNLGSMTVTTRIILSSTELSPEAFDATEVTVGSPKEGEVLVALHYLGLNAGMASRIGKDRDGAGTLNPGDTPNSDAVVEVVESTNPDLPVGTLAFRQWSPWQQVSTCPVDELTVLPDADPLLFATVLGHTGLTAWTSLELAKVTESDHLVVSAAAGGVGTALTQFALARGARVTGIASTSRCEAVRELGADCLDRKAPGGLTLPSHTVFHDAVGGDLLAQAIDAIDEGGRLMIAGFLSGEPPANYNRIIHKDLTLRGYTVMNHLDLREDFWKQGLQWVDEGLVRPVYHSTSGLENAGSAFCGMFGDAEPGRHIVDCR